MTRIKMDKKGVYSEKAINDPVTITIPHLGNVNSSVLTADVSGAIDISTLAARTRYEYYETIGMQTISGSLVYEQLTVDGSNRKIISNMTTWNSASSTFYPETLGALYTITFDGFTEGTAGGPDLVVSFIRSGSDPATADILNQQSTSFVIRATAPFTFIHAVFNAIATEDLMVSGAVFLATTTGNPVTITTASILIKEG